MVVKSIKLTDEIKEVIVYEHMYARIKYSFYFDF